jgi:hypothetical protein
VPFSKILEDEEARIRDIRLRHLYPKPILVRTWRRKPQFKESKALAMSSFRKIRGDFILCTFLITFLSYKKLSCIDLPLMNALCPADTR